MRAAFLVGPQQLELRDSPEPQLPQDGVLLKVEACGLCGSDIRRWREGPATLDPPTVPGHEVAGIVVAVGKEMTQAHVGERYSLAPDVHCGKCYYCQRGLYNLCDNLDMIGITPSFYGGLAEYMAVPGRVFTHGVIHKLPKGLDVRAGALGEPLSSVLATHQRYATGLDDTVVVIGAGPIGCMHVAVARAQGARVIVSQRSEPRHTLVRRFGPDLVINPQEHDLVQAVKSFTHGIGADLAICANPVADTQRQAVELVRKGGTVVLFGGLPKANPMTHLDGNRIHYGEITVAGIFSYHPVHHALALDVLARGIVRAEDLITHTFELEDAQRAMETASAGKGLKALVVPRMGG